MRRRREDGDDALELLPLDDQSAGGERRGMVRPRGLEATIASSEVLERAPHFELPRWLEAVGLPKPVIGTDSSVRRIVEADRQQTLAALVLLHRDLVLDAGASVDTSAVLRREGTCLVFAVDIDELGCVPVQLRAALPVRRRGRDETAQLVIEPWTAHRTEIRLERVPRHGRLPAPRRYFDHAHLVMSALRDELEWRAGAAIEARWPGAECTTGCRS